MDDDSTGKLAGKVALITGAGSGIGRAMAQVFAGEGARIVAVARTGAALEETVRVVGEDRAISVQADVTDEASVRQMVQDALDHYGRIDILCNNAGIGTVHTILETDLDEWENVMAVNVRGVFLCTREVLPSMLEQGGGVIINTASIMGFVGKPKRAAYCASKGAVVALTKSVAVDFVDRGIRCNCICPSTIDGPWVDRLVADEPDPEAARQEMALRHPIGRLGTADEVARAALYLASDDSAFMTGSALILDGGVTAL